MVTTDRKLTPIRGEQEGKKVQIARRGTCREVRGVRVSPLILSHAVALRENGPLRLEQKDHVPPIHWQITDV